MPRLRWLPVSIVLCLAAVFSSWARGIAQEAVTTTIDHRASSGSESRHVGLQEGQQLHIDFTHTAANCFDYDVERVEIGPQAGQGIGDTLVRITVIHEARYGGYIVRVNKRPLEAKHACNTDPRAKDLDNLTVVIVAETQGVVVAFSGGFGASGLTNPIFAAETVPATAVTEERQIVVREKDKEDPFALLAGAFIHAYDKEWKPWIPSITFGLGITDESNMAYYFGPFWRLGNQFFIGGGIALGSVNRLPTGVSVGDDLTDPNTLTNLGRQTKASWFVGVSFTFLGSKEAFEKPFKDTAGSPVATRTASQTASLLTGSPVCGPTSVPALEQPEAGVSLPPGSVKITGNARCKGGDGLRMKITIEKEEGDSTTAEAEVEPNGAFAATQNLAPGKYTVSLRLFNDEGVLGVPHKVSFDVN